MCEEWSWKACRRVEVNRVIAEGGWRRVDLRQILAFGGACSRVETPPYRIFFIVVFISSELDGVERWRVMHSFAWRLVGGGSCGYRSGGFWVVNPQRRVQGVGFVVCRLLRFDDGACCSMHGVGDDSSMAMLSCRDRDASALIFSGHGSPVTLSRLILSRRLTVSELRFSHVLWSYSFARAS
ncbi:hypothetical protein Bca52824_092209 [Brassica carinata]|uniref:Uncharacterized protein n=1 Tax=Brassica carinata TaxID=52824 RepID=A0A8X7TEC7_BRACI|nr:hypothetical protein Bca52824_092209 [Brassica carinata]